MKPEPNHSARAGAAMLVICIGILGLLGTSAMAGSDGGLRSHAKGQYDAATNTYTVVADDDLIGIAARFGTTVGELKTLNKLTTDEILASQTLAIDATVGTGIDTDAAAGADPLPS